MTKDAATGQIEIFHRQQCWLVAEFIRLRREKRTPANVKQLRELAGRGKQIDREIGAWKDRHS